MSDSRAEATFLILYIDFVSKVQRPRYFSVGNLFSAGYLSSGLARRAHVTGSPLNLSQTIASRRLSNMMKGKSIHYALLLGVL